MEAFLHRPALVAALLDKDFRVIEALCIAVFKPHRVVQD